MSGGGLRLLKTLFLPPLLALLLYLLTTYVILPFYRRRPRLLEPLTSHIPSPASFFTSRRRGSSGSGDSLLGDEELEEGPPPDYERTIDGRGREGGINQAESEERRLSVELERGFKDESSESEEEERERGRLGRR